MAAKSGVPMNATRARRTPAHLGKAVAEEMEIKPSILKKAVTIAHKGDFGKHSDDHSMLENILGAVGKLDNQ